MNKAKQQTAAETLAAGLPRLLLAAERLAFTAAPGLHSRRRAGAGEAFWQFQDWREGDDTRRIDWRRSAMGDRVSIRQQEWQAQADLQLHLHDTASLDFRSHDKLPTKRERAILLLLALAALLLRAGERVALAGITPPLSGPAALSRLATALTKDATPADTLPAVPRARQAAFGDFLLPNPTFPAPPGGVVLQILDPAECDFPYSGRVSFEEGAAPPLDAPNAAAWRAAYLTRLAAQRETVARAAQAAGQTPLFHRTDAPPTVALGALYQALQRR